MQWATKISGYVDSSGVILKLFDLERGSGWQFGWMLVVSSVRTGSKGLAATGQLLKLSNSELKQAIEANLTSLRRFCYSLTGNGPEGDDLAQSTVERLLNKGVPSHVPFSPWMFRVCKNLWIDTLRSGARMQTVDAAEIERELDPVDGAGDSFRQLQMHEVNAAIARLNTDQRMVLGLVSVEGYSYREAAEILEIPIGTVMSRLARARKYLLEMTQMVI